MCCFKCFYLEDSLEANDQDSCIIKLGAKKSLKVTERRKWQSNNGILCAIFGKFFVGMKLSKMGKKI